MCSPTEAGVTIGAAAAAAAAANIFVGTPTATVSAAAVPVGGAAMGLALIPFTHCGSPVVFSEEPFVPLTCCFRFGFLGCPGGVTPLWTRAVCSLFVRLRATQHNSVMCYACL